MGNVVTAQALSHAPLLWTNPENAEQEQLDSIHEALERQRSELDAADPDVIVAFLNDHYENFFRGQVIPQICVGIGDDNYGPLEQYLGWLPFEEQQDVPNDTDFAKSILDECLEDGLNPSYSTNLGFGHNLMMAIYEFEPDVPIVPVMINTHQPPALPPREAYKLGETVRRVVDRSDKDVAFLATGALSHWIPMWYPHIDEKDYFVKDENAEIDIEEYLERRRKYQEIGKEYLEEDPDLRRDVGDVETLQSHGHYGFEDRDLVATDWDREVMRAFGRGDAEYFKNQTYESIIDRGGEGGYEILNWIALLGAVHGAPADVLAYEGVEGFVCGMGYMSWHDVTSGASA